MRLDDILIQNQLASVGQINDALAYQKHYGGRLESHLFRFGYTDEVGLLKALALQFNCRSVSLGGREISESVLNMVPAEAAFANVILPFDYDPVKNTLMIACENPANSNLAINLEKSVPGKNFEFYIALGPLLKSAIVAFYRNSLAISSQKCDSHYSEGSPANLDPDSLAAVHNGKQLRILICNDNRHNIDRLEQQLTPGNFELIQAHSIGDFVEQYEQLRTHIMVLIKAGTVSEVCEFIGGLISRGVMIEQIPTFLLTDDYMIDSLMQVLNVGIEDVISREDARVAAIKINRVCRRLEVEKKRRLSVIQDLGTHGTLEDMNVIDIIQAMGPSEKTARISITGNGKHLTMFLDRGNIIYSECDDKIGPDAVYEAIPWDKGVWSVDPIGPEELPEPNNFQSNESILLEGCRRLDEQNHEEQPEIDFFSDI